MPKNRITVDYFNKIQPIKFDYSFATTYTEDSGRPQGGRANLTPMFTVEAFDVEYPAMNAADTSLLLKTIVPRPGKPFFNLFYFSPYEGVWQTRQFYVGEGTLVIKHVKEGEEEFTKVACSFVGRDKIC